MSNEKPLKIKGTLDDLLKVAAKYVPPVKESKPKRKPRKKAKA